jgi:formate dehydrogenase subunit gamma
MTPSDRVVRYGFAERAVHTIAAIVFVYLLLTGLAFWTPAMYWIATVLGGGFLSRLLHPWAGVLFALVTVWMVAVWRRDMRTTDADRQWRRAMASYIRNEDANLPQAGRFNFGQKMFFWIMVWGTVSLFVSGLVLWAPDWVPREARIVRDAAILVHAVAALAVTGAFIVHIYMGVFVVPGSVEAIVHGSVTREWARHHHRAWADDVAARAPLTDGADPRR